MNIRAKCAVKLVAVLAFLAAAHPAAAESDKFLCVEGYQGGSTDSQFAGCSEVYMYSQTLVSRELDPFAGGGKEFKCGDVAVVKRIDAASPALLVDVLRDTVIPSLFIYFRSREATPEVFLTVELRNVSINAVTNSEYSPGTGASALAIDMETLAMAANIVRFAFTPKGQDGQPATPVGTEIDCFKLTATPF